MKKLLLVLSSVRTGRAADNILSQVEAELKNYPDFEVSVADFSKMPLPLFDSPLPPSQEGFVATDENVKQWTQMVADADAVVFLVAEYNYSFTAVLKNAIDWMYKPWNNKPVAFIGYGWAGGSRAIKHLRDVMNSTLAALPLETEANLHFMKQINLDGSVLDAPAVQQAITEVLEAIKAERTEPVAA